jgi:hypothetical protein
MRSGRGVLILCRQGLQWEWQGFQIEPVENVSKEVEAGAIEVEATQVSNKLPVEWVDAKDNETQFSLGKPGKDETNKLEEGAIGVEAKEKKHQVAGGGSQHKWQQDPGIPWQACGRWNKIVGGWSNRGGSKGRSDKLLVEGSDAQRSFYFMFLLNLVGW